MHQLRFFWKLYLAFVAVIVLITTAESIFLARQIERESLGEIDANLRAWALFLRAVAAPYLEATSPSELRRELRAVGAHVDTRLTVMTAAGAVLAESGGEADATDSHANRPEIVAARVSGSGVITRYSHTLGQRMRYFALPVHERGVLRGYVRAALPLTVIDNRIGAMRKTVAVVAAIAAILALTLAFALARRISRPLGSMMEAAYAIASGHYEERIHLRSRDEFAALAAVFNSMAEQLQVRIDAMARDRNEVLAILSSMVEGVIAVDPQERIVQINEVAARLLEASVAESIGRPIWEVTRSRTIAGAVSRAMHDGTQVTDEMSLFRAAGDLHIELHASPLRDRESAPAGVVVVFHDVTRLRELESLRRDFVTNVSHEFKTPVTAIRALVETLLEDSAIEPQTRQQFLEKIKNQCGRLTALVEDLLALSRAESLEGGSEQTVVDLREPALEALRMLAPAAEAKGLSIEQQLPALAVPILGDWEGLREIAGNLLDNAVKYTPAGGRIRLRITASDEAANLEIEDTGIGIPPQDLGQVFERFYRVDKARSRQLGGTGLGLSIVKHLAQAMGGQVSVESTLGKGSLFRVAFPVAAAAR